MTNTEDLANAPDAPKPRSAWLRCPVLRGLRLTWRFKRTLTVISLMLFLVFETWTPAYWLSEAIYFEARDEPWAGRIGVANVVFNRKEHRLWPNTVPEVIDDGRERSRSCDMSYRCDGKSDNPWSHDRSKWNDWLQIRAEGWLFYGLYSVGLLPDVTCGAVYYKRHDVRSTWFSNELKAGRMAPACSHEYFRFIG